MKAKPKRKNMQGGGQVRGPGTSRSDSIPAQLSAGEWVAPADTVRKVGLNNLEAMRRATHRFADGGFLASSVAPATNALRNRQQQIDSAIGAASGAPPTPAPAIAPAASDDPDYNSPARVKARERLKAMGIQGYADGGNVQTNMPSFLGWLANKYLGGSYGQAMSKASGEPAPTYVPQQPAAPQPGLTVGGLPATPDSELRARINARLQQGYADGGSVYSQGLPYTTLGTVGNPAFSHSPLETGSQVASRIGGIADQLHSEYDQKYNQPDTPSSPSPTPGIAPAGSPPGNFSFGQPPQQKPLEGYDRNLAQGEHRYAQGGPVLHYLGGGYVPGQNQDQATGGDVFKNLFNLGASSAAAITPEMTTPRQGGGQSYTPSLPAPSYNPGMRGPYQPANTAAPFSTPRLSADPNLEGQAWQSAAPTSVLAPAGTYTPTAVARGNQPGQTDTIPQTAGLANVQRLGNSYTQTGPIDNWNQGNTDAAARARLANEPAYNQIPAIQAAGNRMEAERLARENANISNQVNFGGHAWSDEQAARNRRVELANLTSPRERQAALEFWKDQDAANQAAAQTQQTGQYQQDQLAQQAREAQMKALPELGALGMAQQKLGLELPGIGAESQLKQYQVAQARDLEALRQRMVAEKDPAKQRQLAMQLSGLLGKANERYTVVPYQEINPATNMPINRAHIIDNFTGDIRAVEPGQGATPGPSPYQEGQTAGGKPTWEQFYAAMKGKHADADLRTYYDQTYGR